MFNRYSKIQNFLNTSDNYSDLFMRKKINSLNQYYTYDFGNLQFLKQYNLERIVYTIQPFDKLYLISQNFYNSPEYGWLICYTNKKKSELEFKINDIISIYFPLQDLLELLSG